MLPDGTSARTDSLLPADTYSASAASKAPGKQVFHGSDDFIFVVVLDNLAGFRSAEASVLQDSFVPLFCDGDLVDVDTDVDYLLSSLDFNFPTNNILYSSRVEA
jgi:hypothetical protein